MTDDIGCLLSIFVLAATLRPRAEPPALPIRPPPPTTMSKPSPHPDRLAKGTSTGLPVSRIGRTSAGVLGIRALMAKSARKAHPPKNGEDKKTKRKKK
ncbi:hypothetical protein ACWDKQ_21900, partial [Saccharopolyspora sp. NPDC000995]